MGPPYGPGESVAVAAVEHQSVQTRRKRRVRFEPPVVRIRRCRTTRSSHISLSRTRVDRTDGLRRRRNARARDVLDTGLDAAKCGEKKKKEGKSLRQVLNALTTTA